MEAFFFFLELVGYISFAVAGSIAAIDKESDIFGVLFLSLMTCFGGGMLRDVLIDRTPVFFTSYLMILISVLTTLAVFLLAAIFQQKYIQNERLVERINNYFDAVGLGVFAVAGVRICIEAGFSSPLVAITLGMITSVGGGMVRDLCLREIPRVFRKRVYAVASLAGAATYYILHICAAPEYMSLLLGTLVTVLIRVLATTFLWNMPKAIVFEKAAVSMPEDNFIAKK